jgi:hypothetical protein
MQAVLVRGHHALQDVPVLGAVRPLRDGRLIDQNGATPRAGHPHVAAGFPATCRFLASASGGRLCGTAVEDSGIGVISLHIAASLVSKPHVRLAALHEWDIRCFAPRTGVSSGYRNRVPYNIQRGGVQSHDRSSQPDVSRNETIVLSAT